MSATPDSSTIGFGDTVRIVSSATTIAAGVAGVEGEVHGFTTPSVTGVTVIGATGLDYALGVFVEKIGDTIWLEPSSIEFVSRP